MKMVFGGSQKPKALFGNFQIARTDLGRAVAVLLCGIGVALCGVTHNCVLLKVQ